MDDATYEKRLSVARERMLEVSNAPITSSLVTVGDTIPVDHEAGFLRGHGTELVQIPDAPILTATVCGLIERVNKLVSVRPFSPRYSAQTGDVVIGRVTEVGMKRWKIDINSEHDAHLMLSAVNLPGGIQRRRNAVDELNMRTLYTTNDLISAEVQSTQSDGSAILHTRSLKYGKLESGQLVLVFPYLIKRMKHHFHSLSQCNVNIIIGCNGYVWISPPTEPNTEPENDGIETPKANTEGDKEELPGDLGQMSLNREVKSNFVTVNLETRQRICRVARCVKVLGDLGLSIFPEAIANVYTYSLLWGYKVKDMNEPEFKARVMEREAENRERKVKNEPVS